MPCYHVNVKTVGRSKSGAAIVDYIERTGKYAHDNAEVLAKWSENIPSFAKNAREYFAAADIHERANGRLGKKLTIALPNELSASDNEALVKAICADIFREKTPYLVALHEGDGRNPHAHIFVSERVVTPQAQNAPTAAAFFRRGVAKKTSVMKSKDWLLDVRKTVAQLQNKYLYACGVCAQVDHRTLAAQGIQRTPQAHRGPLSYIASRENIAAIKLRCGIAENESFAAGIGRQFDAIKWQMEQAELNKALREMNARLDKSIGKIGNATARTQNITQRTTQQQAQKQAKKEQPETQAPPPKEWGERMRKISEQVQQQQDTAKSRGYER